MYRRCAHSKITAAKQNWLKSLMYVLPCMKITDRLICRVMTERPTYHDGYTRIGDSSDYMDVAISMEDANALLGALVSEMFAPFNARVKSLEANTDEDDTMTVGYGTLFSAGTRAIPNPDFVNEPSAFIGAHLRQFEDDGWRLSIMRTRTQRVDDGMSERRICTFFKIICWGDAVVEAHRTVKFIKVTPAVLATGKDLTERGLSKQRYYKRVGFTSPMLPEDCETMAQLITRHSARVRVERGI